MINRLCKNVFIYLMPIFILFSYLKMRGIDLNTYIWYPILFIIIFKALRLAVLNKALGNIKLFNIFVLFCIGSFFIYLINSVPINCYVDGIKVFLLPTIFTYIGCYYPYQEEFKRNYLYACLFCFGIGLYLYFTLPPYYSSYIVNLHNSYDYNNANRSAEAIFATLRFCSFLTNSYSIEFLGVPALILSIEAAIRGSNKWLMLLIALLSLVSVFLCQQRAGIVFAVLILFYYFFHIFRKNVKLIMATILMGLIIGTMVSVYIISTGILDSALERLTFSSLLGALGERTMQYTTFSRITPLSILIGLGVGSCGHTAIANGLQGVADGEFVKLFFELGIIGFLLFLLIIKVVLTKALKHFSLYRSELFIILFFLFTCIGTNALSLYVFDFIFWYSIGIILRNNKIHK